MGGLRGQEILIIVILLILVFGWKRLPDAARSLGRSARVFKSEVEEMKKDGKDDAANGTVQSQAAEQQRQQVTPPPVQDYQAPQRGQYRPDQPQAQPHYEPPRPQAQPVQEQQPPDDPTRPVA